MVKPLWNHQQEIFDKAKDQPSWALWLEMGTGKTRTAIELLKYKMEVEQKTLKTLIIAPSVVQFTWKRELTEYSKINPAHILVLHGTQIQRWKALQNTPNYFVVIINYESLLMETVYTTLKEWAPEVIIADESQRIKSHSARRTKHLIALSHFAKYKYALSGTPITNNECDLFSQYLFLDNGKTFGKSFFAFKNAWFTDANAKIRQFSPVVKWPRWIPKSHRADEFKAKAMSIASSVTKDECLDLPPYIQTTIECEMSPEQRKAYKEMKDDYLTFLGSTAFTADLAIVKAMRLQQITAGFIMDGDKNVHFFKNTPKDKALIDLIESASSQCVVWSNWRANHQHLRELFKKEKINFREMVGDTDAKVRDEALVEFANDPSIKVMLASAAAAGVGVSLVSANTAIYYSRNFSYEHDAQSAARIHRGGQKHEKVFRIDLVIPDTIDISCLEALKRKEDLSDAIIYGNVKV